MTLVDTDTAEEVVSEMIAENVLPSKYETLVMEEIKRLLREKARPVLADDKNREEIRQKPIARLSEGDRPEAKQWANVSRTEISREPPLDASSLPRIGSTLEMLEFDDFPNKDYADDVIIEDLVNDVAVSSKRGIEKAQEWLVKLRDQDIMTVGDLRDLQNDDWSSL